MIKNLMDKLHSNNPETGQGHDTLQPLPVPKPVPHIAGTASSELKSGQGGFGGEALKSKASVPTIHDNIQQDQIYKGTEPAESRTAGWSKMRDEDGIVIDLGEGISLNIPIQKRMTLSDFLRVAEKVKALEMLSEEADYKKNY